MNNFYVEYFRLLSNLTYHDLGKAVSDSLNKHNLAEEGAKEDAEKQKKTLSSFGKKLTERTRYETEEILAISKLLNVSPHWFSKAPCLIAMSNLFYYLALANKKSPNIIKQQKQAVCNFDILDTTLAKWLMEYYEMKISYWDKKISDKEWDDYRYNCLKESPRFIYNEFRFFIDFLEFSDIKLPILAKQINTNVDDDTIGNIMRKLRLCINGVSRLDSKYAEVFMENYELTTDDFYCPFYFSGVEDFFNLFVVADIMLCEISVYTTQGKTVLSFDKLCFENNWKTSSFSISEEFNEDRIYDVP